MKISAGICKVADAYGYEKAFEMAAKAGFDCVDISLADMSVDENCIYLQPDWLEQCRRLRAYAESFGLTINQTHAPIKQNHAQWQEGEKDKVIARMGRAVLVSGALGARNVVVHPLQYWNYLNTDPKEILETNLEFYGALIPYAQEAGVKIAIENMWQNHKYNKNITLSVCSSPYEHREYVDACNAMAPVFTACLDVGHCVLTGHDPAKSIEVLGERLQALHIHDVDGIEDSHTCPLTLNVDFESIMEALRKVNYPGEFNLETTKYFTKFAAKHYDVALRNLLTVCKIITE